ncbi:MAG TPA: biopolymer transporter ExbD [bacterium]|nr:biopolymer transporter ExbD [bacterium]HNT64578.1 biopolymer transporter ExbD [bacterium]HOX84579.1 biopolymer transporter ExbD [bacterium]HPG45302.1 biopolymer transporter ExbD [bacterium]HPM98979.1 biopolymer transporter ExbD [bacterium]
MNIEASRKRMIAFSTIGLTDIVLLLLIFFLLSSSFVVQPGIKIQLPRAASGQSDDADHINLTITKREQIFLNQQQVSSAELGTRLRQLLQDRPDRVVVIRADKDLTLETTVRMIDTAKLAGAERFIIATEPQAGL